jgi:nucleoid-associated protein YgaU
MGKTEKIVVLTVLFAIVVLFVWSLDQGEAGAAEGRVSGDPTPAAAGADAGRAGERVPAPGDSATQPSAQPMRELGRGPGSGAPEPLASRGGEALGVPGPVIAPRPHAGAADGDANGLLLSAEVGTNAAGAARRPVSPSALRGGWDIVTVVGLETTPDEELFLTRARAADTWEALAERYYGDTAKVRLLRRSNEGTALADGVEGFIPAIDRLPRTPEVREVEVLEGEGLWNVAKRALGSGSRWTEIHAANQDRIVDPNFVKPGTLLRLP